MKAAFLTYNSVGGFISGVHERGANSARVLSNSRGTSVWALADTQANALSVENEIDLLWSELVKSIHEIDQVVVYVGTDGSGNAIELASQLDPGKVTYVLCDCGLSGKQAQIRRAGHAEARQILCECRGIMTMGRLCETFLETGSIESEN